MGNENENESYSDVDYDLESDYENANHVVKSYFYLCQNWEPQISEYFRSES